MADETLPPALEKDAQLFERVTEALRAGPGTAAWEEALTEIGGAAGTVAAEMEALAKARRRLAAGRSWREVSAGEGFTAKLWAGLEAPQSEKKGPPITRIVVVLALGLVTGLGAFALLTALRGSDSPEPAPTENRRPGERTADNTSATGYGAPRLAWDFGMPWPAGTSVAGTLALDSSGDGLRVKPGPVAGAGPSGGGWQGAAAFASAGWPAEAEVVVEFTLDVPAVLDKNVVTQLFVSATETVDPIRGTTPTEWVCQVDDEGVKVIASGGAGEVVKVSGPVEPGVMVLRATLRGKDVALDGGDAPWEGQHALPDTGQRFVGVRFLARGKVAETGVPTVKLVRVLNLK